MGGVDNRGIAVIPRMPRFETVKVTPDGSGGVTVTSGTATANRRTSAAIDLS